MRGLVATLLLGGLIVAVMGGINPNQRRRLMRRMANINWLGGSNRFFRSVAGMAGSGQMMRLFRRPAVRLGR